MVPGSGAWGDDDLRVCDWCRGKPQFRMRRHLARKGKKKKKTKNNAACGGGIQYPEDIVNLQQKGKHRKNKKEKREKKNYLARGKPKIQRTSLSCKEGIEQAEEKHTLRKVSSSCKRKNLER